NTYFAMGCDGQPCADTQVITFQQASAPNFDNCEGSTTDLGCNPNPPACRTDVAARNECGDATVDCSDSGVTTSGCNRSQTFTYTATPSCGTQSTCSQTFTWKVVTAPQFDNCSDGNTDLGCNPPSVPGCDPTVAAHNECGSVPVTCQSTESDDPDVCHHARTLVYTATDACSGLSSSCTRTYTWTRVTAPVFDNCTDGTSDLGCNPPLPACDTTITAHNECGSVTGNCQQGQIASSSCNRTQAFTYTATGCGLTSTCIRTFTWTRVTAPVFDNCTNSSTELGCNPASIPTCATHAPVLAHNDCGSVPVTCDDGTDVVT